MWGFYSSKNDFVYAMILIDGSWDKRLTQDYSLVAGCESPLFIAISRRKENRDDIFKGIRETKKEGGSDGFSQDSKKYHIQMW